MDIRIYKTSNLILITYIAIIIILNFIIKNLNLTYVLFSIITLNWAVKAFFDYKNEKNNINILSLIGSGLAFVSLLVLIF